MIATFGAAGVVVPDHHRHLTAVVDGLAHDAYARHCPEKDARRVVKGAARSEDDVCFGIRTREHAPYA